VALHYMVDGLTSKVFKILDGYLVVDNGDMGGEFEARAIRCVADNLGGSH